MVSGVSEENHFEDESLKQFKEISENDDHQRNVGTLNFIGGKFKGTHFPLKSMFPEFRFLDEPEDTLVVKNQPATLKCSAVGPRPPKIRWKRNGEFLQFPDFNDRRRLQSDGSLYFSTIYHKRSSQPDEGLYQCVASVDGLGTIVSRMASLQVS
ncbi:hypothetical protein TCAL_15145, partial [Tigriopus californicus]